MKNNKCCPTQMQSIHNPKVFFFFLSPPVIVVFMYYGEIDIFLCIKAGL